MEVIKGLTKASRYYKNLVLTLGKFETLHLGHQEIIKKVVSRGKELKVPSGVFTLVFSSPRSPLILSLQDKIKLIASYGIDLLILVDFEPSLFNLLPGEFVKHVLREKLRCCEVHVGQNFTFGKGRVGTAETLKELCQREGIRVEIEEEKRWAGKVISSSEIKRLITTARLEEVNTLLGRAYSFSGWITRGKGRGSEIGYPTANIVLKNGALLPPPGVYTSKVKLNTQEYLGVMNIGASPTFGDKTQGVEVHILEFKGQIYYSRVEIELLKKLRDIKEFPNPKELQAQISQDIKNAQAFFY
jgi:riboflavin kinase/FMN adenylyltransferase